MNQYCYIDRLHHLVGVGGCGAVLLAIAVGVGGMWVPLGWVSCAVWRGGCGPDLDGAFVALGWCSLGYRPGSLPLGSWGAPPPGWGPG